MVDAASNTAAPRVVVLARAGKAADHLAEAVRHAGAELLATVDPATADEQALRALNPQAVVVALEPSIEPMLDKLAGLLADPALTVIYDEADVAAQRAGWDAARWVRHLSAKLRNDSNVLPPGAENDQEWQPSPGQIPKPSAAYADVDMTAFTREAHAHADSVPADGMPADALSGIAQPASSTSATPHAVTQTTSAQATPMKGAPPPLPPLAQAASASGIEAFQTSSFETMAFESSALEASPRAASDGAAFAADDDDGGIESVSLDSMSLDSMSLDSMSLDSMPLDSMSLDSMSLQSMQLDDAAGEALSFDSVSGTSASVTPMRLDEDAFFLESMGSTDQPSSSESGAAIRFDSGFDDGLDLVDDDAPAFGSLDMDAAFPGIAASRDAASPMGSEEVMSFESLMASSLASAAAEATPTAAPTVPQSQATSFSLGDLSLSPVDEAPVIVRKPVSSASEQDIASLEARISSLSLVDFDEGASAAETSGIQTTPVVLIEAGLGGPDPARQLLASLSAEFAAVVLVRLHLQGGRYDRLVAQMERTAALPVALAQSGATASAGTIYFLPDDIGLTAHAGTFAFVASAAPSAAMLAALPSASSALVFLSGSDPQLVDSAMSARASGTLVVVQSPEDCYDGAACAELRNRGVASGLPAELAGRLASRWPS